MRRFCWAALLLLVIAGCQPKIPVDIIQPQKIRKVLYDIHVVEGYTTTIPHPDSMKKVSATYYKGVYKKFGIDSALYTKSMDFYFNHPDMLSTIYIDVTAALQKSKDSVDKIQEKILKKEEALKKAKKDSIDKANPKLAAQALALEKAKTDSLKKLGQKPAIKPDSVKRARRDSIRRMRQIKEAKFRADKKLN